MTHARKTKVLLIDDDEKLAGLLGEYTARFDIDLVSAADSVSGLKRLARDEPDLVILDVMLPGKDGFAICKEIRAKSAIPIIMLTARGETADRVVGLELGADDYLAKPFEPRELVARITTILRRSAGQTYRSHRTFGPLEVRPDERSAALDGRKLDLTTMEYELLHLFTAYPGKKFSRDEIMNHLQGIDANIYSRSVDVLVSRLRQKLNDTGADTGFIRTVWGTGYVFVGGPKDA